MTTATNKEALDTVNNLLETCRDGEHGFDLASKSIDDPTLRSELLQYSLQRQEFAADLKRALADLGEEVSDSGSVAGALHRGWINIKSAISSNDRHAVLAECERGEDSAVAAYREATMQNLPPSLAGLVMTQYQAVQRVHDRIKLLRDMSKTA
ncbi:MAG: PA2169 family four-helix-bundle protein [Tepidisphaeraceae bacterium]